MTQTNQPDTKTTDATPDAAQDNLCEAEVAEFLQNRQDFFERFPEVLETLHVPHEHGASISLVERQTQVLREKNQQLEKRLAALLAIAQRNEDILGRMQRVMVEIAASNDTHHTLTKLQQHLTDQFAVEYAATRLLSDDSYPLEQVDDNWVIDCESAAITFDQFVPGGEPVCGRIKHPQLKQLFGDSFDAAGSAALTPLRYGRLYGVLALASKDEQRFEPGMNTLYLKRLGEVVAATLWRTLS